ncbi:hypothetical protein BH23CHL5_BH23CHL5_21840 [soil metagenome]
MSCSEDFCTDEEQSTARGQATDRLYQEIASNRLIDQLGIADAHQQRIAGLMTIGSIVLPLTAGVLTSDSIDLDRERWQAAALALAVVFYVGLVICFYFASRFKKWDNRPEMQQWKEIATSDRSESELLRWLGDAYVEAFTHNRPFLGRKAQWIAGGIFCLSFEVLWL